MHIYHRHRGNRAIVSGLVLTQNFSTRRLLDCTRSTPPRPPVGLRVAAAAGAPVGGVNVRTSPGLLAVAGLPPVEGPVSVGPARILASLSATEGPVEAPATLGGGGAEPGFVCNGGGCLLASVRRRAGYMQCIVSLQCRYLVQPLTPTNQRVISASALYSVVQGEAVADR